MRRRTALGVLAGLSSGCLRLVGSPDGATSPSPAPVDTPGETTTGSGSSQEATPAGTPAGAADPSLPLGLTEDGVEPFLIGSHKNTLTGTGFRSEWARVRVDHSKVKEQKTYRVDDGVSMGTWGNPRGGELTMFRNHEGGFWREDLGDFYTYGEARHGHSIDLVVFAKWLNPIIAQGEWLPPTSRDDQEPAVWETEVRGFDQSDTRIGYFNGHFESLDATMRVDEQGVIRHLQSTFTAVRDRGGTVEMQVRYTVDSIGDVSVPTPSWLSTAKDQRPTVSAALTDDQQYVRFTHESGNPLEPDTNITVFDEQARRNAITYRLNEAISPGETVYLYRVEQSGRDRLVKGTKPSNTDALTLDSSYRIWATRATVEYFGTVPVD